MFGLKTKRTRELEDRLSAAEARNEGLIGAIDAAQTSRDFHKMRADAFEDECRRVQAHLDAYRAVSVCLGLDRDRIAMMGEAEQVQDLINAASLLTTDLLPPDALREMLKNFPETQHATHLAAAQALRAQS